MSYPFCWKCLGEHHCECRPKVMSESTSTNDEILQWLRDHEEKITQKCVEIMEADCDDLSFVLGPTLHLGSTRMDWVEFTRMGDHHRQFMDREGNTYEEQPDGSVRVMLRLRELDIPSIALVEYEANLDPLEREFRRLEWKQRQECTLDQLLSG